MHRFQFSFLKTAQMTPWERARFLGADHVKLAYGPEDAHDVMSMSDEELKAMGRSPFFARFQAQRDIKSGRAGLPSADPVAAPFPLSRRKAAPSPAAAAAPAHDEWDVALANAKARIAKEEAHAASRAAAATHAAAPAAAKSRAGLLGALAALGGTGALAAGGMHLRRKQQQQQLANRNRALKGLALGGALGLGGIGLANAVNSEDTD